MATELLASPSIQRPTRWLGAPILLALWVIAGGLFIWGHQDIPLERTQEARVLECAREMLHQPFDGWMIPHANGVERLHKPPLAYWLAAGSFSLFGVNLFTGRLPTAIAGWLMIGLVFWCTAWLFERRAGFFAATGLFASFLFIRFFHLAETDPLSALFTTAATFFLWRGMESEHDGNSASSVAPDPQPRSFLPRSPALFYHAGAAMLGLALLAKGPQVLFVLLFILCYAALRRKWRSLWHMIRCGAPLTFVVIGLPWWVYVYITRGAARWRAEIEIAAEGKDHDAWFYVYIPYILLGVTPWCAFVVGGIVESIRRIQRDWRQIGLLIWSATILIPLCLIGNKQIHYLIPLMMPLMILTGWLISQVWVRTGDDGFQRAMSRMLLGTIVGCLLVPAAVVLAAREDLHHIRPLDWGVAAIAGVCGLVALIAWARLTLGRAFVIFALCGFACMAVLGGQWMPTLDGGGYGNFRQTLESYPANQPIVFYSRASNLRLSWFLRRVVPVLNDPDDLKAWLKQRPGTLVVVQHNKRRVSLPPPSFLVEKQRIATRDESFGIYAEADPPAK